MNLQLLRWGLPLLALAVVAGLTATRLRESAGTRRGDRADRAAASPYAELTHIEEWKSRAPATAVTRNPFAMGASRETATPRPARAASTAPAPVRERPVLTAIVSDADPRALIRYENRNYTVKSGDLFAEFRVVSVSAERVILETGSERIVLNRPLKGE